MSRAREIYRRSDSTNYLRPNSGNLDTYAERQAERMARLGSTQLRNATHALFRRWERRHGFVEGAAEVLLLAGWSAE